IDRRKAGRQFDEHFVSAVHRLTHVGSQTNRSRGRGTYARRLEMSITEMRIEGGRCSNSEGRHANEASIDTRRGRRHAGSVASHLSSSPKYAGFPVVHVSPQCWPPPSTVSVSPVMNLPDGADR